MKVYLGWCDHPVDAGLCVVNKSRTCIPSLGNTAARQRSLAGRHDDAAVICLRRHAVNTPNLAMPSVRALLWEKAAGAKLLLETMASHYKERDLDGHASGYHALLSVHYPETSYSTDNPTRSYPYNAVYS